MISIIVPVYNNHQYLKRCLDSILAQTLTDIEVILINDGSTDQSGKICDKYATKDNRIKVIHQQSKGVSSARNKGVELATGDYIGFVDGDDYIVEDMYEHLYKACMESESHIAICKLGREINGKLINREDGKFYIKELDHNEAMSELFKGMIYRFSLCNKLFNRNCFEGVSFPVGRIHEDLSTTYKLFSQANQAVYINKIGYIYVKQKNSILTTTYHQKRLDVFTGWDEIIPFMKQEYPQLFNEVMQCFVYDIVDHLYYILNQVEDKTERKRYLNSVQLSVRKHYKNIKENATLSLTYKFITTVVNYNIYAFVIMNKLRRAKR